MKKTIFNARWMMAIIAILTLTTTEMWGTTIASWGKVAIPTSDGPAASNGDANNKNVATITCSINLSNEGTYCYYNSSTSAKTITISGLTLTGYRNIKISFYSRASAEGTLTLEYSTDGTYYYDLVGFNQVTLTKSEVQYTLEGIPSNATSLKFSHSKSSGSLYFGTAVISGDLASECSEGLAMGIAIGDTVTFYESYYSKEMTAISSGRGTATGYSSAPEGTMKFKVVAGNSSGTLSFYNGSKYLGMSSGENNALELQNSKTDASSWTFDFYNTGYVEIKNKTYTSYFLKYNDDANQFSSYTENATHTHWIKMYHPCIHLYNVTYDGNSNTGGTVPEDNTNYTTNSTVTVLGNTGSLTRTDCTFAGWNTAANGSGTSYTAGATFSITEDVTLYAKWTCTVTWMINGVEYTTDGPTRSVVAGNKVTVLPPNPETGVDLCNGTDFMGWTATNMGADLDQSAPADLFTTAGASPTITRNVTFYAVFADPD